VELLGLPVAEVKRFSDGHYIRLQWGQKRHDTAHQHYKDKSKFVFIRTHQYFI